jgi:hypothetical protein
MEGFLAGLCSRAPQLRWICLPYSAIFRRQANWCSQHENLVGRNRYTNCTLPTRKYAFAHLVPERALSSALPDCGDNNIEWYCCPTFWSSRLWCRCGFRLGVKPRCVSPCASRLHLLSRTGPPSYAYAPPKRKKRSRPHSITHSATTNFPPSSTIACVNEPSSHRLSHSSTKCRSHTASSLL